MCMCVSWPYPRLLRFMCLIRLHGRTRLPCTSFLLLPLLPPPSTPSSARAAFVYLFITVAAPLAATRVVETVGAERLSLLLPDAAQTQKNAANCRVKSK